MSMCCWIVLWQHVMLYILLTVYLMCRLSKTGFETVSALTFTVQINYCATVLWAALDTYAPAAWNTYSPAVIAYIVTTITSLMNSRVSGSIVKAQPVIVHVLACFQCLTALIHNCPGCHCPRHVIYRACCCVSKAFAAQCRLQASMASLITPSWTLSMSRLRRSFSLAR